MGKRMEEVNVKHIIGVLYYANGNKHEGNWRDDKCDGIGKRQL